MSANTSSIPAGQPDPSIPPTDGHCLFFSLTGELRNQIYEYALSYADGLSCVNLTQEDYSFTLRPKNPAEDHTTNPLRSVCRQLRAETLALPLKINTIYYHEPAHGSGWLFTVRDFIENLAERYTRCVGEVVVETNHRNQDNHATVVSMVEWLETRASFCAEYAECNVLVRFEWNTFNSSPEEWMYCMAAMEMAVTGKSLLALLLGQEEELKEHGSTILVDLEDDTAGGDGSGVHVLPTNLRFTITPYPKEQVRETLLAQCEAGLITEAQVELMVVHAGMLFEQGIRGCETDHLRKAREEREKVAREKARQDRRRR